MRNIPVREWQTCLLSKKDNATLKITVSYSSKILFSLNNLDMKIKKSKIDIKIQQRGQCKMQIYQYPFSLKLKLKSQMELDLQSIKSFSRILKHYLKFNILQKFLRYNTITEYRPNLLINEEAFSVPSGIYCPGRQNTKPLPAIPSAFSYITHKALSGINTDSLTGTLEILRVCTFIKLYRS